MGSIAARLEALQRRAYYLELQRERHWAELLWQWRLRSREKVKKAHVSATTIPSPQDGQ